MFLLTFSFSFFFIVTCHLITVVDEDKRKKINMVREVVKSALGYHMQSVPKDFPDYTSY